jgi:hypothetical protein
MEVVTGGGASWWGRVACSRSAIAVVCGVVGALSVASTTVAAGPPSSGSPAVGTMANPVLVHAGETITTSNGHSVVSVDNCDKPGPHLGPTYSTTYVYPDGAAEFLDFDASHVITPAESHTLQFASTLRVDTFVHAGWTAVDRGCYDAAGDTFFKVVAGKQSGTGPTSGNAALLRRLMSARSVLVQRRAKMEASLKTLEDETHVFCVATGLVLAAVTVPAKWATGTAITTVYGEGCGAVPGNLESAVDAKAKLDRVNILIGRLDQQIAEAKKAHARSGTAHSLTAPLAGLTAARAAASGSPLAALTVGRQEALGAIESVNRALGDGDLPSAQRDALTVARRLTALPAFGASARRYLERVAHGRSTLSRSKIISAVKNTSADPLPAALVSWATVLHIGNASMRRQVLAAKAVPISEVKTMTVADLVDNPDLDQFDRSLAATYRLLAQTL